MSEHLSTATAAILWLSALAFIVYFAREYQWLKSPMGRSLMTMAVGVLILATHGVLYQVFGPEYRGRSWVVPAGRLIVTVAFIQRIFALRRARRDDPEVRERPRWGRRSTR